MCVCVCVRVLFLWVSKSKRIFGPAEGKFSALAWIEKLALYGGPHRGRRFDSPKNCLKCIFSLSLLLRFFSGFDRKSSAELRKHDILYKYSALYRILRHII